MITPTHYPPIAAFLTGLPRWMLIGLVIDGAILVHAIFWIETSDALFFLPLVWIALFGGFLWSIRCAIQMTAATFRLHAFLPLMVHVCVGMFVVYTIQDAPYIPWKFARERSMLEAIAADTSSTDRDDVIVLNLPDQHVLGVIRSRGFLQFSGFYTTSDGTPPHRCHPTESAELEITRVSPSWFWVSCIQD
jgi:hypothetical protein